MAVAAISRLTAKILKFQQLVRLAYLRLRFFEARKLLPARGLRLGHTEVGKGGRMLKGRTVRPLPLRCPPRPCFCPSPLSNCPARRSVRRRSFRDDDAAAETWPSAAFLRVLMRLAEAPPLMDLLAEGGLGARGLLRGP